ncbi:hypothetical protein IMAU10031_01874 [Lactobacillus helveticus]|nr:type II toxin-antitoxin system YafQ family toxin [Lactobacillus helveticus]NRO76983.1 hypothetical protein [Lactobacillus helveticus]NRO80142.1 hypothetical protein [Lactobacillus helveticus]
MFLLKLHDLIKHNYENGLYSKDYSYKAKDYSYKSDDFNSLSDFDKGKFQAQTDYQKRSPWKYIIQRLIEDKTIPDYFYPHALEGLKDLKKQIKRQLNDANMTIIILELHFDGHNGDHLLVYVPTDKTVFLASIGTHSELFG